MFGKPGKPGKKVRAVAFGVVSVSTCVVLAACSPVKMGAAAIVGSHRITASTLATQVSGLQTAAKPYASQLTLTSADMPAAVLSWLIRFQIGDQVAKDHGISVTPTQIQAGISDINQQAASAASQEGLTSPQAALLNAGISPQMLSALGRYQAQELAFAEQANGGKLPTTAAEGNAVTTKLTKAQCSAAKKLNIQVNPQFGRLDFSQYTVVPAPDTLSRPAGTPSPAPTTGLAPAC